MLFAELLKFIGTIIVACSAIAGIYLDGTKSVYSGNLTRKGYTLILLALLGVVISGSAQVFQFIDYIQSAEDARLRYEATAVRLEKLPVLIAKNSFPLEPIELFFELEFSMDQPELSNYASRVQKSIVNYCNEKREIIGGATIETLENEEGLFALSNVDDWKPNDSNEEKVARDILFQDASRFTFRPNVLDGMREIVFKSVAPEDVNAYVSMPRLGEAKQKIEILADFKARVFIKNVRATNPLRTGSDAISVSAFDIVGSSMEWKKEELIDGKLTKFAMRFAYDYGFSQNYSRLPPGRELNLTAVPIVVDATNVGLQDIINEVKKEAPNK